MYSVKKLVLAATMLAAAAGLHGEDKSNSIWPIVGASLSGSSTFSDSSSFGIGYGIFMDAAHHHQVTLEWTDAKLTYDSSILNGPPGSSILRLSGRQQPLVAGYRFHFDSGLPSLRLYAGPALGYTRLHGSSVFSIALPSGNVTGSYAKWRAGAGVAVGATYSISPDFSIQLGYRLLRTARLGSFESGAWEGEATLGPMTSHLVTGTIAFAF